MRKPVEIMFPNKGRVKTRPADDKAQVPSKKRGEGGYAHFPGTGPDRKKCSDCAYSRKLKTISRDVCYKWHILADRSFGDNPPIDPYSAACRYFEEK